jgi:hypothetical protein
MLLVLLLFLLRADKAPELFARQFDQLTWGSALSRQQQLCTLNSYALQ